MKRILLSIVLLVLAICSYSQELDSLTENKGNQREYKMFIAYELGEMAFNKFQNFSGEIGVKLKNQHMLRFVYQNVRLSEEHLSSNFATSVDGEDVHGLMKSYEFLYGIPIVRRFNLSISAGYANDFYEHTKLHESVENYSGTIGFAPGYRETDLFKVKGLYFNFEIPFRFYFNPLEKTELGNSTVNRHFFVNNIWFFVGYQF